MTVRVRNEVPIYEYGSDNTLSATIYRKLIIESHHNDSDRVIIYLEDSKNNEKHIPITVLGKDLIAAITNAQRTGNNW